MSTTRSGWVALAGASVGGLVLLAVVVTSTLHGGVARTAAADDPISTDMVSASDTAAPTLTDSGPAPAPTDIATTVPASTVAAAPVAAPSSTAAAVPVQQQAPAVTSAAPTLAVLGPVADLCGGLQCYSFGDACPDSQMMQATDRVGEAMMCGDPAGGWVWMRPAAFNAWLHPMPTPASP